MRIAATQAFVSPQYPGTWVLDLKIKAGVWRALAREGNTSRLMMFSDPRSSNRSAF